ncbi:MAG: tetratricopeptide repeat protein [Bacteriovoracaceae bacterium]|nr:tetratricopeptide repeat protein [Bacteriovoracaceae bacterium]
MIKKLWQIFSLSLLLLLVSCAMLHNDKLTKHADEAKQEIIKVAELHENLSPEELIAQTSKKFDALIAKAKQQGPEMVRFFASDLYLKGSDASLHGNHKTAAFIFKYVLKLTPEDSYLKQRYAVELIHVGEMTQAMDILEKLFENKETQTEKVGLILGGIYTALNYGDKAQQTYKKILSLNSKSEEACMFLAKSYATKNQFKSANKLLGKCEKQIKNKGIFSYFRGKVALDRSKRKQAKKYFKKSLKIEPTFYQAALALGLLEEEGEGKENFERAQKIYKDFLEKRPDNFVILTRLTQLLFIEGKFKEAIPYLEQLTSIDQEDLNLKVKLGIIYTDENRIDEAKSIFKEILKQAPNSDKVLYYLGSLYQETEDYNQAIEYFNNIQSDSPLFYDSCLQIGKMLHVYALQDFIKGKNGHLQKLEDYVYLKAGQHREISVDLMVILASYYENTKNLTKAIAIMESIQSEKGYVNEHDYYVASLYEKNDQFSKAEVIIKNILAEEPNNADALNFLGYSYLDKDISLDKAYEYIAKAVKLKPDDGYIQDSLGWYYYKRGEFKRALKIIKRAWEKVKDDVVINKHLATIYADMKKYKLAKKFFVEALKHCTVESDRMELNKAIEDLEQHRLPASVEQK